VWADGSSLDYTNWASGEPNDWGDSEDCVSMYTSGEWNDLSCSTTLYSVCKISDSTRTLDLSYYSDDLSYEDAGSACEASGGTLVASTSSDINSEILSLTGGAEEVWIGLDDESTEGTYVWADGSSLEYTNWASGEPNDWQGSEDCVGMYTSGEWNDYSCSTTMGYVCQVEVCADGFTAVGNDMCLKAVTEEKTWSEAQEACEAFGTSLAVITSETAEADLSSYLQDISDESSYKFWIGLSISDDTPEWVDGSDFDYSLFQDSADSEDGCVVEVYNGDKTYWDSRGCKKNYYYVCRGEDQVSKTLMDLSAKQIQTEEQAASSFYHHLYLLAGAAGALVALFAANRRRRCAAEYEKVQAEEATTLL